MEPLMLQSMCSRLTIPCYNASLFSLKKWGFYFCKYHKWKKAYMYLYLEFTELMTIIREAGYDEFVNM